MTFDKSYYSTGVYEDYDALAKQQIEDIFNGISTSIHVSPAHSFLDVGCGFGHMIAVLRQKGFKAQGIEISDYCCQNSPYKEWITPASATAIPFESNSFDITLSNCVLYYLDKDQIIQAVKEIYRVSRIGVYVECITSDSPNSDQATNPDDMRQFEKLMTTKQWEALFQKTGFTRAPNFTPQPNNPDFHGLFLKPSGTMR